MNIDAKISIEQQQGAENVRVNEPLGEAYSAYWNWWLRHFAKQAEARFPAIYGNSVLQGTEARDPLSRMECSTLHEDAERFSIWRVL